MDAIRYKLCHVYWLSNSFYFYPFLRRVNRKCSFLFAQFLCYSFWQVTTRTEAHNELNNFRKKSESALIISGTSLEVTKPWDIFVFTIFIVLFILFYIQVVFDPLRAGVCRVGMPVSSSCVLPLFSHSQGSCGRAAPDACQKACGSHWRWRQRCEHDPGSKRRYWNRGEGRKASLSSCRLLHH